MDPQMLSTVVSAKGRSRVSLRTPGPLPKAARTPCLRGHVVLCGPSCSITSLAFARPSPAWGTPAPHQPGVLWGLSQTPRPLGQVRLCTRPIIPPFVTVPTAGLDLAWGWHSARAQRGSAGVLKGGKD